MTSASGGGGGAGGTFLSGSVWVSVAGLGDGFGRRAWWGVERLEWAVGGEWEVRGESGGVGGECKILQKKCAKSEKEMRR